MLRGVDENKDQTYFLWTLTQQQLSKTLFPVGNAPKKQIRKEAENAGLITAGKKDSQGICFLGQVDIPEFLSHYVDLTAGEVLTESGEVIGTHVGALVYTNGQRHGFTITTQDTHRSAYYVVDRDMHANTITVSPHKEILPPETTVRLEACSYTNKPVAQFDEIQIQTRYRQTPIPCKVISVDEKSLILELLADTERPSVGQSCVLYLDELCLGGGIIAE